MIMDPCVKEYSLYEWLNQVNEVMKYLLWSGKRMLLSKSPHSCLQTDSRQFCADLGNKSKPLKSTKPAGGRYL